MDWTKQFSLLGLSASAKAWAIMGAAALAVALAVFGAGTGFGYAWGKGSGAEELAKVRADQAKKDLAAERALTAANERNRAQERDHAQAVADLRAEFAKTEGKEHETDARVVADLRSGDDQLRFPVRTCAAAIADASNAAESRAAEAARAELAPATSAALYSITADGDTAIREGNALIDWVYSLEASGACTFTHPLPPKEIKPWTSQP